jgi:hypothetical protein
LVIGVNIRRNGYPFFLIALTTQRAKAAMISDAIRKSLMWNALIIPEPLKSKQAIAIPRQVHPALTMANLPK